VLRGGALSSRVRSRPARISPARSAGNLMGLRGQSPGQPVQALYLSGANEQPEVLERLRGFLEIPVEPSIRSAATSGHVARQWARLVCRSGRSASSGSEVAELPSTSCTRASPNRRKIPTEEPSRSRRARSRGSHRTPLLRQLDSRQQRHELEEEERTVADLDKQLVQLRKTASASRPSTTGTAFPGSTSSTNSLSAFPTFDRSACSRSRPRRCRARRTRGTSPCCRSRARRSKTSLIDQLITKFGNDVYYLPKSPRLSRQRIRCGSRHRAAPAVAIHKELMPPEDRRRGPRVPN